MRSDTLVKRTLHVADGWLTIGSVRWPLETIGHIEVVGAGKAGAGMASGVEAALGPNVLADKQVSGWLNVPADCVQSLTRIHLHAARPAGCNEPTEAGVHGAMEILRRVRALQPHDLCICLISGGGSALLPAPVPGITLADLLQVTRDLSAAGATIQQLNAVRRQLSLIQGGRLAQACRAGRLVTLIISDVMGDPLDIIASGPTVIQGSPLSNSQRAIDVVAHFQRQGVRFPPPVLERLRGDRDTHTRSMSPATAEVFNFVIGNNQTATGAAHAAAEGLGYRAQQAPQQPAHSTADETGRWLADMLTREDLASDAVPAATSAGVCVISGGEPVVKLVDAAQARSGRSQSTTGSGSAVSATR